MTGRAPTGSCLGELLEAAVNNLWLGIILFDSERKVIFCNPRYREMYALSPEQVRPGTPVAGLIEHGSNWA